MQMRHVGKSGLKVTEISFGGASIGNLYRKISDEDAREVLNYAWSRGIRFFDTAPRYGRGLAEARLGQFLRNKDRQDYVISTKVGRVLSSGIEMSEADGFIAPLPNNIGYDYSGDGIEAAFEQSCERLGTSMIDILYVHDIGELTHGPVENARHMKDFLGSGFERLQQLKASGRIRAFGLGVNENEVCLEVMNHGYIDVILLAGRLTLLDRSAEDALISRCVEAGTSLVLGGIFNSGILAIGPVEGATYDYLPASDEILDQVRDLQTRAAEYGIPLATAALHYASRHSAVASVLIGTAKVSSLKRNLDALSTQLPDNIDELFD
ncbi:MAG: aldo/keto reductase [Paracoccaceae bacterium]